MPIYDPSVFLTSTDREALSLLGQLILAPDRLEHGANFTCNEVPLSLTDSRRLLELLEQFASSKLFQEGAYFTDGLANGDVWSDDRLRNIYLAWLKRRGKTQLAGKYAWNELVVRSGLVTSEDAFMWPRWGKSPARPMTLPHFLKMESRLVTAADLHPRVRQLVIEFVTARVKSLELFRNEIPQKRRSPRIADFVTRFIADLSNRVADLDLPLMPKRQVVALVTVMVDVSALFTTRDWTAAGVLSGIASQLPDIVDPNRK